MEINAGWISAGAAIGGLVIPIIGFWIRESFASRDELITSTKATVKILFEKHDIVTKDLQDYKLRVAETYVNQAALEKLLMPIERRLETIEDDLRKQSE